MNSVDTDSISGFVNTLDAKIDEANQFVEKNNTLKRKPNPVLASKKKKRDLEPKFLQDENDEIAANAVKADEFKAIEQRAREATKPIQRQPITTTTVTNDKQISTEYREKITKAPPKTAAEKNVSATVAASNNWSNNRWQIDDENKRKRNEADAKARTLRISSLWDKTVFIVGTPLQNYRWPNYSPLHHDQTLVKIDFIIDYLNNMLLIEADPTTFDRMQSIVLYEFSTKELYGDVELGETVKQCYQNYDVHEFESVLAEINSDTWATTKLYEFDPRIFGNRDPSQIRYESKKLVQNDDFAGIYTREMSNKKTKKRKPVKQSSPTESCDNDIDDYELVPLEDITAQLPSTSTIYSQMKTSQYELEHPHYMTPMHQRLFIGKLNDLVMPHSSENMRTYRLDDVAWKVFGLSSNNPCSWSREYIMQMGREMASFIMGLMFRMKKKSEKEFVYVYEKENAEKLYNVVYRKRLTHISHQITVMMKFLLAQCDAFQMGMQPAVPERPSVLSIAVTTPLLFDENAYKNMTPYQRTLRRIQDSCQEHGYRRRDGAVYRQVITAEGYATNAFERLCDIKDYVWKVPDMNLEMNAWKDATSAARVHEHVITYLTSSSIPEYFPDIKRQQYVWSFKNGIYDGHLDKFWVYGSKAIQEDVDSPYKRVESSSRYIDKDFDYKFLMSPEAIKNPRLIQLNAMNRIFNPQKLSEDVKDWVWAFTGRLYFPNKMLDNWQVVFWLKGVAGTGKSTYATAVKAPYDPADVAILQNNMETQFGLEPTLGKLLILAPDVKSNFSLDPALFQTMAAADPMAISRKGIVAITIPSFPIPQLYLSNVYPNWVDSSGSIQRRIMSLLMEYPVPEKLKDTTLEKELLEKLDYLVVRACRSYKQTLEKVGKADIWKVVPDAFKFARDEVSRETAELVMFFEDFLIVTGENDETATATEEQFDFVEYADLESIFHKQKQTNNIAMEKGDNFKKKCMRDIKSFHNLRVEACEKLNKKLIIRGCRLNLERCREVKMQVDWLPQHSNYFTAEQYHQFRQNDLLKKKTDSEQQPVNENMDELTVETTV